MMSDAETRANAARQLLENPLLVEAFANVRETAIAAWTGTSALALQDREMAWLTVKVLDRITGELESIVTNGKIAASRVHAPLR